MLSWRSKPILSLSFRNIEKMLTEEIEARKNKNKTGKV